MNHSFKGVYSIRQHAGCCEPFLQGGCIAEDDILYVVNHMGVYRAKVTYTFLIIRYETKYLPTLMGGGCSMMSANITCINLLV